MAKDPYKFQRAMNKLSNFLWSTAVKLVVLIAIVAIFIFCLPWLKALWGSITGSGY